LPWGKTIIFSEDDGIYQQPFSRDRYERGGIKRIHSHGIAGISPDGSRMTIGGWQSIERLPVP
jgi:hypothetical protein